MSRACPAALRPKVGLPKWSALQAMFWGRERERQMHAMVSERSRKKEHVAANSYFEAILSTRFPRAALRFRRAKSSCAVARGTGD